jgi:hypothetical protein
VLLLVKLACAGGRTEVFLARDRTRRRLAGATKPDRREHPGHRQQCVEH